MAFLFLGSSKLRGTLSQLRVDKIKSGGAQVLPGYAIAMRLLRVITAYGS